MAEPMILELLSNLKTRVATNETNIAKNASTITANKTILDNHMADDVRHWTTSDRQNFDRVVHFKGYFTTEAKLKEAYATGALGDYAIVGATDTVWLWDDTTSKWLNSTEQGIVISVNGRTGEVVLTKTDVGLSNVDNTSDKNKPVSTAQQTALNAKADRKKITISEADSLTLKAGIYDINNGSKTILGFTAAYWTVIVGENNGSKSAIQIWTNYNSDVVQHIYIRKQQSGSSWSEFKELATNTDISNLQTQITTNKNNIASNDTDIANLNNYKADRKQVGLDELNGFGLKAGIYDLSGTAMTILGFTSKYWTIIVGEETGQSHKAAVQIWINYTSNEVIHMYIRRQQGNHASWSSFTEILTTSHLSTEQIALAKQYKGYYATADALTTAQKTGTAGDYAVVGENQVMFIWNTIENAWTSIINEQSIGSGAVTSVNGMVGAVTLTKSNVGLTNVDNTSDKNKPVSTAQQAALDKKVNKAGDTLTGNLSYNMNGSTQIPFKVYGGDVNGQGISVGAGGATIIGSGESAKACESLLNATTEELWVTSDNAIKFYTNCQTIGNKVGVFLNASRAFYPDTNNTGTLGTSSNKWNNVYATTFTGNLSGNASTASKLQTARTITNGGELTGSFSFDGSGNVTNTAYIRYAKATKGNTSTYPFCRIATSGVLTGQFQDKASLIYITQDFIGGSFGLIRVTVRTNGSTSTATAEAKWLIRSGFAADNVQIGLYNVYGKTYLDVFCKINGGYGSITARFLDGTRGNVGQQWTLISSYETDNGATHSECYKTIQGTTAGAAAQDLHNGIQYTNVISGTDAGIVSVSNSTSGNATTATKLQTARTINGVSFDGTKNITVADSTKIPLAGSSAITGNLAPKTNNTGTLGTSSLKWSGIYTSQINGQNVLEYEIVDEW